MKNYNLSMIEELADDDVEFLHIMIETFVKEVPGDILAMNEAIENENPALTYQIVHKMKPNLQMFGLNLSSEVGKLETWNKGYSKKEDVLVAAEMISDRALQVTEELKNDFDL